MMGKILVFVVGVILISAFISIVILERHHENSRLKCESIGGYFYRPYKSKGICLNKDTVYIINGEE